ncbi:MAG: DUF349 domain-containing protein [Marinobacter sp.]|uniref:DUF349 domain-containing protein n=1 Tax=Marinobacter sp. TaxID=50741 RepID=UPI00299E72A2|nr:DUF349 domain-containing protein [Marinobacter sp.]MDX1754765.1 DUF349 domain-containing protein [Marinobacter sp.]
MAAFIQKLFRSRKPTATPEPEPSTPSRQEQQDEQREQQARLLEGTPSQQQLEELALTGVTADLRRRAASAIHERDALLRVQKAAKGKDKSVYQIVRQALQEIRDQEEQQQKIADQIRTLIKQAEDQARSEDTKLYQARLEALQGQWEEVEPHASKEQVTAFLSAVHQCRERMNALAAEEAEQQRQREQADERKNTLELLASTVEDLKAPGSETLPSVSALDALQKTQENRWLEATRDTAVGKSEQKAYESLMQAIKGVIAASRRLGQHREAIQALISDNERDAPERKSRAANLLTEIEWPKDFPLPAELLQVRQLGQQKPVAAEPPEGAGDQQALARELKQTLECLESTLEARQLKESRQHFKKAQNLANSLSPANSRTFQSRLQLLGGQLRELNDWQGFATQPKQIALCEQMEYLADQPMEPEAKAERIKELQNEWRNLGGSSDRNLWSRFKQASDRAYEPCRAYFSVKSELKQTHLETRRAICDQLQEFVDQADWNDVDWKAVDQIHRTAREEWKAAWPVDFRDNRPVQKRFDDLLKQIEAPLNEERQRNEQRKQAIVEAAEQLVAHEPLSEAMEQAKALQNQWRSIGITRHREDRKLWRAFRKACDAIFARRDAQRSERRQQTQAADQRVEATLAETLQLQPESATGDVIEQALSQLQSLRQEPLSREKQARLADEIQRLGQLRDNQILQARIGQWQVLIRGADGVDMPADWGEKADRFQDLSARELVIRAEILTGVPSQEADQARRMEIQVQRLSEGLGGGNTETPAGDQLESLIASWCVQIPASDRSEDLTRRLQAALTASID